MFLRKIAKALIEDAFFDRAIIRFSRGIKKLIKICDFHIGKLFRVFYFKCMKVKENRIVLCSFQGDYTDNPKYICEELIRQKVKCEIIWIGRKKTVTNTELLPTEISAVYEWFTIEAYEAIATAKVIVINSVELYKRPVAKKKGQIIIETWHGSLGFKRFDKNVNSGKAWVKAAKLVGKYTDYLLSNSDFENDVYRNSYWPKTSILKIGHPRNDCLFNSNDSNIIREKIFSFLDIDDCNQKILLYAPTFRDSKSFSIYNLDYQRIKESLEITTNKKWLILLRFHPTVRKFVKSSNVLSQSIKDITTYPDMNEILQITDIGISDYSSWLCDYVLTRKPAFIYASDIADYETERGFYYPLEESPFSIATNNDEMIKNLLEFNEDDYRKKCDDFLNQKGCIEDGHASERVVDFIENIISDDDVKIHKTFDKWGGGA